MPDAYIEVCFRACRTAIPVYVSACLLDYPSQKAEVGTLLGQVFEGKIACFADESIGGGGVDQFEGLGMREVIGKQNGGETIECACWEI